MLVIVGVSDGVGVVDGDGVTLGLPVVVGVGVSVAGATKVNVPLRLKLEVAGTVGCGVAIGSAELVSLM